VPGDPAANAALVNRFYEAFARRDAEAMGACYSSDIRFVDPAFGELHGAQVTAMWRMLCERGTDLEVVHSNVSTDGETGSAHWDADYTFTGSGRKVHNSVDASFRFEAGLIADHVDSFDLYKWARQALGPVGVLFGWTPAIQRKIRSGARESLDDYMTGTVGPGADAPG
jgi:ketosteroid isomerase-like protein